MAWREIWNWMRRKTGSEQDHRLIRKSGLFDTDWYLLQYPDVGDAGIDPLEHYMKFGSREGRNPNPMFETDWYLSRYADVRAAGVNPLLHYLRLGAAEGRNPSPRFNGQRYLKDNPDAAAAQMNPLGHYLRRCKQKRRNPRRLEYLLWVEQFDTLTEADSKFIEKQIEAFRTHPIISVVMPVYAKDTEWLQKAIDSVRNQLYPHWELCISDDASPNPQVRRMLAHYAARDPRIRVTYRKTNGHISVNSNSALGLATGEFVALMDCDDELPKHALFWVAHEINHHPDVDLIYSDEDKIDTSGERYDPYFKPDWNPALLLSQNYFSHLGVYRRSLVTQVGGFRTGFEGSQDYDLLLRCSELTSPKCIRHIARVLYHWRSIPGSVSSSASITAKPYAWQAGARAIAEHLKRTNVNATVDLAAMLYYQVNYALRTDRPRVSIIMPSACKLHLLKPCLESLFRRTSYLDFELVLVVNEIRLDVAEQATFLNQLRSNPRIKIFKYKDQSFNYSRMNNWAVRHATGSILCFLNDDIEIVTIDWLEKLVARLQLPDVAAVGVKLLYGDDTIQHAGVILGLGGVAGHPYLTLAKDQAGYFGRAVLEQDLSCVTAACVAVRREVFESIGGFDEALAVAFNDVDLCIRMRNAGWRILWTPSVEHYHHESASLGRHSAPARAKEFEQEVHLMKKRWKESLASDPFYNPNLSLHSYSFELGFPPRVGQVLANVKVAVIVHVFYQEIWEEIVSWLQNIPIPFDLYITTPTEKAAGVRRLISRDYPEATVINVANAGRDIGGFLTALPLLRKGNYTAICKLHTKKGATDPATWRHLMLRGVLGNPMLIIKILQAFQSDEELCLVGPRDLYVSGPHQMHKNRENLERFVQRVWPGRRLPRRWGFFAGTMFWIGPRALERIASAFHDVPTFEDDNTKNDGQKAHAFERLFGLVATMEGMRIGLTDIIGPEPLDAILECTAAPGEPRTDSIEEMLKIRSAEFAGTPANATTPISLPASVSARSRL